MRIVLDTNIVVSSLWGGLPRKIMEACKAGHFKLLLNRPILEEYIDVLSRFDVQEEDMDYFEALFVDPKRTENVSPTVRVHVIKEDPSDNKFLECALSGKADFIVSGDKHLLGLGSFRGIPIVTPRSFLGKL